MASRTARTRDPRLGAVAALALAAGLFAALLPGMAQVPTVVEAPTGPLAAPAPVSVSPLGAAGPRPLGD
jgi:hypothetical protein